MAFMETTRFPEEVSYGTMFKPSYSTRVVSSASGFESRNVNWKEGRFRSDISYGIRTQPQLTQVINLFHVAKGRAIGFRYKNWSDYKSGDPTAPVTFEDQALIASAVGGETAVQLIKTYIEDVETTVKTVRKPVLGTVVVGKNGGQLTEGPDFSVDTATGIITLAVPLVALDTLTAGYEWDVPVRFDVDELPVSLEFFEGGGLDINVVEVRKD